jgi:hypothetical protein
MSAAARRIFCVMLALFDLVLSPTAARRAIPGLGAVTAAGMIVLWYRASSRR